MKNELEKLIDTHGLPHVLELLIEICDEKSQHVLENWQDKPLAKDWQRKANTLTTAKLKLEK